MLGHPRRPQVRGFVELFALCGFAVAQPLLDIFGLNPTQFIYRDALPTFEEAALPLPTTALRV